MSEICKNVNLLFLRFYAKLNLHFNRKEVFFMTKRQRTMMLCVGAFALAATMASLPMGRGKAFAASDDKAQQNEKTSVASVDSVDLFAALSLSLNGGDGKVWATVRNDFTLFPSTVSVVVQLFCSLNYTEDYHDMECVAMNSTEDLDQGNMISAESGTNGEQKYWIGRLRWNEDYGEWKDKTVGPLLYSAEGEFLGVA